MEDFTALFGFLQLSSLEWFCGIEQCHINVLISNPKNHQMVNQKMCDLEAIYIYFKRDKLSKAMACDGNVAKWHCLFEPPLPFHLLSLESF
jgi:hypothetical protein